MKALSIDDLLSNAKELPPSPEILPKLLTLLQDEDATYTQIAKLIHLDQSLTTQVLTWSNAGYYGYLDRSADIEEAISRVGLGEIYKVVGIIMSKRLLNKASVFYGLDGGQLFENSIASAFSMEALSAKIDADSNLCYTVGLLHSIGKIVIDQACQCYDDVFDYVSDNPVTLVEAEEKFIGYNHAQVGEALLMSWDFESSITEPIGYQYKPSSAGTYKDMAYLMNVCHYIVTALGHNHGRAAMAFAIDDRALDRVRISDKEVQATVLQVQDKLEVIKSQLATA